MVFFVIRIFRFKRSIYQIKRLLMYITECIDSFDLLYHRTK